MSVRSGEWRQLIERSLRAASSPEARAVLVGEILSALPDLNVMVEALHQRVNLAGSSGWTPSRRRTRSVLPGGPAGHPLSDTVLMTNARNEPTLAAELWAEFASHGRVDLLCAFVKWQDLRLLEDRLNELHQRNVALRVLMTSYLGATDARALDALVDEFGAEVRINYETDHTQLHAKAWLLRRDTGFHTAYVGSTNLSHAALVDGLKWNGRLSAVSTPHLLEKFRATFESYWENCEFEPYQPSSDRDWLRDALDIAAGARHRDRLTVTLSGLEVHPKPFQAIVVAHRGGLSQRLRTAARDVV